MTTQFLLIFFTTNHPRTSQKSLKKSPIDYCGSVEKNALSRKSFCDQNNTIDAIYNKLLYLLNLQAVIIGEGNWSVVTDQRENLFKSRLVENVSKIQLIAFFRIIFSPHVVRVVSFSAVFSTRIPFALQSGFPLKNAFSFYFYVCEFE